MAQATAKQGQGQGNGSNYRTGPNRRMSDRQVSQALAELRAIDPFEFEHFVAKVWECRGFQTSVTEQSGDMGIDVRAVHPDSGEKHLIQAKRYSSTTRVTASDVRETAALWNYEHGVTQLHVVTTGGFTTAAVEEANHYDVIITNGNGLVDVLQNIKNESGRVLLNAMRDEPAPKTASTSSRSIGIWTRLRRFAAFVVGGAGALLILFAGMLLLALVAFNTVQNEWLVGSSGLMGMMFGYFLYRWGTSMIFD